MSSRSKYLASLDIGSSKICCMIGTQDNNGINQIVGLGYNKASGISKGVISDFNLAAKSISNAILEAEKQANIKISDINISTSSNIVSTKLFNKRINILENRVKNETIDECLNLVMRNPYFEDKHILHASPVNYSIDGASEILNPVGMYGTNLDIDFIISTIGINHYKNYIECISLCNLDIGQLVFSGLASGVAVLNDNELMLGSVVIEIGSTTTSLSIFSNGNFLFSEVISFGGNNITEAIARFFSISFNEAEKIKIMHASAIEHSSDKEISFEIPSINLHNNENYVQVSKKDLYNLVKPFVENLLKWIKVVIQKSGVDKTISKQLVITGGGSQLDGLSILTKNYLNCNSRIGFPRDIKLNMDNKLDPSHSVAIGTLQSIFRVKEEQNIKNLNSLLTSTNRFSFIKNWMSEKFF